MPWRVPQERTVSSEASPCCSLGYMPSWWHKCCMARWPRCWKISEVSSVGSSFCNLNQSVSSTSPFVAWIIRLMVFDAPGLRFSILHAREYHNFAFRWHTGQQDRISCEHKLVDSWSGRSGLVFFLYWSYIAFLFWNSCPACTESKVIAWGVPLCSGQLSFLVRGSSIWLPCGHFQVPWIMKRHHRL